MRTRESPRAARSFERRFVDAGALDLKEAGCTRDHHDAVVKFPRGLTLRSRRDDRSEKGDVVHVDDRCTDVVTDGVHAFGVTASQRFVEVHVVRGRYEIDFETDVGERLGDDLVPLLLLANVAACTHRRIESFDDAVAVTLFGGYQYPHRPVGGLQPLRVLR